jgi:hypothetical protein
MKDGKLSREKVPKKIEKYIPAFLSQGSCTFIGNKFYHGNREFFRRREIT